MAIKTSGRLALLIAGMLSLVASNQTNAGIAATVHNLTASGPGTYKTSETIGLCVFCHTPHDALTTRGLWNHKLSTATYKLYYSSTIKYSSGTNPGGPTNQPTGDSRFCLSCHDGTLALSDLNSPPKNALLTLGPLQGSNLIGGANSSGVNDLSNDHPFSFVYDSTLTTQDTQLLNPSLLPSTLPLDSNKELQCSTCHDPHTDKEPDFLRMDNRGGAMCTSCHNMQYWATSSHSTSTATWNGTGADPWPSGAYSDVADNACGNCHRTHNAGHAEWLMAQPVEYENCTDCHNGTVASQDIASEFNKASHHPIDLSQWTHTPDENPLTMSTHVTCADCHNPHAANTTQASPPLASGALLGVKSMMEDGTLIDNPTYQYQVCNKCHGVGEPTTPGILRESNERNIRLLIDPTNTSFHPIAAIGKNTYMMGFTGSYNTSSRIGCISCHNNDAWTPTGTAPSGPHGSIYSPILAAEYDTSDPTPESAQAYALCYQCHSETYLTTSTTQGFPEHITHVVQDQAPCADCHNPHGSQNNPHLIDFMLKDLNGNTVVSPSPTAGIPPTYTSTGNGHGSCTLECHGVDHDGSSLYSY